MMGAQVLLWAVLCFAPPSYGAEAATADVKTLLEDSGKPYLEARARLEANPERATPALEAALEAAEPGSPSSRRLLRVLGEVAGEAHLDRFADSLLQARLAGEGLEPWRGMLVSQGGKAVGALAKLVADERLELTDRQTLLDDLVSVVPSADLPDLVRTLGRGDRAMSSHLRRALRRRALASPDDRAALYQALGTQLAKPTGEGREAALQKAALVRLRASIDEDGGFVPWLAAAADDADEAFAVRVASVRALGGSKAGASPLETVVKRELAPGRRDAQSSEVLGSIALDALGELAPDRAKGLADSLTLRASEAPRLAGVGYAWGTWKNDMLDAALGHPWPEVRAAAVGRVVGPCDASVLSRLAQAAGPQSKRGEADERTGRAVVTALGRCGGEASTPLRKLMRNDGITFERRGVAARELVKLDGAEGAKQVALVLMQDPEPALAERLASALEAAESAGPEVKTALCRTIETAPNAATPARAALAKLFPGERCE